MQYSEWFLESIDKHKNEAAAMIEKRDEKEELEKEYGEVEFDIDNGPVVVYPKGLGETEEEEIAFSSLPDIRSQGMTRERFIFKRGEKYYHVSFIQEENSEVKRGYVQKSVFIKCGKLLPDLPRKIESVLEGASEYRAEVLKEKMKMAKIEDRDGGGDGGKDGDRDADRGGGRDGNGGGDRDADKNNVFKKLLEKHRRIIFENIIRCRSFLVLGESPTEVSDAVCILSKFCGFSYGGEIVPYRSSFIEEFDNQEKMIGGTNEHIFKTENFDNVFNLKTGKYHTKYSDSSRITEKHFEDLQAYFLKSPYTFSVPKFIECLEKKESSLKTRRVFREFFESKNFPSWLDSLGYKIKREKKALE